MRIIITLTAFLMVITCANAGPATTQTSSRFQIRLVVGENDPNAQYLPFSDKPEKKLRVSKHVELSDDDIESARPEPHTNDAAVEITFTDAGMEKMSALTKDHIGDEIAFVFDGTILCAPRIASEIGGRKGTINIGFSATREDAAKLAKTLNEMVDNRVATTQPDSK